MPAIGRSADPVQLSGTRPSWSQWSVVLIRCNQVGGARPSPYFKLHVSPASNCERDARAPRPIAGGTPALLALRPQLRPRWSQSTGAVGIFLSFWGTVRLSQIRVQFLLSLPSLWSFLYEQPPHHYSTTWFRAFLPWLAPGSSAADADEQSRPSGGREPS